MFNDKAFKNNYMCAVVWYKIYSMFYVSILRCIIFLLVPVLNIEIQPFKNNEKLPIKK